MSTVARRALACTLALCVSFSIFGILGGTEARAKPEHPEIKRVVVLSMPFVAWQDAVDADLPALNDFVAKSSIASMVVRGAISVSKLDRGYATLGAGTRATAGTLGAAAFNTFEAVDNSTTCQVYRRRTGWPCIGEVMQLGIAEIIRENENRNFGAVVGELGEAVLADGIAVGVYGNADGPALTDESRLVAADINAADNGADETDVETTVTATPPEVDLGRMIALAGINTEGRVPLGNVSEELLEDDPRSPYGVRLSIDAVAAAVQEDLDEAKVIFVEASDLERVDRGQELTTAEQHAVLELEALRQSDRLLARILELTPLDETLFIVTSPAARRGIEEMQVFAMAGPGVTPGTMAVAPTTRQPGFVTLTDVAPTILAALGVERPSSMTGRPITVTDEKASVASLIRDNEQALSRDSQGAVDQSIMIVLIVLIYVAAGILLWRKKESQVFAFLSIWIMNVPISMFLLRLYPFERFSVLVANVIIYVMAFVLALLMFWLRRIWLPAPVVAACTFLCAVLVVNAVFFDSILELNSPLGYSSIIAGRFYGFSNLPLGLMLAAATILGGLAIVRWGERSMVLAGVAIFYFALVVVIAAPMWGANVGGMLGGSIGLAVTWILLTRIRLRVRHVLAIVLLLCVVVAAVAIYDLLQPTESQSHLARLLENVKGEGPSYFLTVVQRKVEANWRILTSSIFVWLVPTTVAFFVVLAFQKPGLGRVFERMPPLGRAMVGAIVTGVFVMAFNDSGIAIPAMMLALVAPMLLYMRTSGVVETHDSLGAGDAGRPSLPEDEGGAASGSESDATADYEP